MLADTITIRLLGPEDADVLGNVAEGVFDNPIRPDQAAAFLASPSHLIVVALAGDLVVGMAMAVITLQPDKLPQLFINEVGTADSWLRQGIATKVMTALLAEAERQEFDYIWLGTEADNEPARALYRHLRARETAGLVIYDWGEEEAPA